LRRRRTSIAVVAIDLVTDPDKLRGLAADD
jgi:hypothetical protein